MTENQPSPSDLRLVGNIVAQRLGPQDTLAVKVPNNFSLQARQHLRITLKQYVPQGDVIVYNDPIKVIKPKGNDHANGQ